MVIRNVQKIQNDIFRKMSAQKKIRLASNFTSFCIKINQLNKNGNRRTFKKSYSDS